MFYCTLKNENFSYQGVDGFILNADESCENKLRHSWTLTDVPHDIDYIIESVCHFDEIVNEWTSHSLISKLVHIVRNYLQSLSNRKEE